MYENNSIETMQWTSLANVHKWNPTKRQTRDTYVHIAHTHTSTLWEQRNMPEYHESKYLFSFSQHFSFGIGIRKLIVKSK